MAAAAIALGAAWAGLGIAGATPAGTPHVPRSVIHHAPSGTARATDVRKRAGCPSLAPGATLTIGDKGYAREGVDTFTKSAPLGSFAQRRADAIVYTGDHGLRWTGYPDGWPSTYSGHAEGYQPSTVLSVHHGMLDFHLHNDPQGNPVGADPSPLPRGRRYQTYGAWSLCERVAPADVHNLADFHQAFLLLPAKFSDELVGFDFANHIARTVTGLLDVE